MFLLKLLLPEISEMLLIGAAVEVTFSISPPFLVSAD
jgi:hypothetical protein